MAAMRNFNEGRKVQSRELISLSSGDRIQKAAYDPSGLAISETMRSRIRSMGQAYRNTNNGVSLLQSAEGGLTTMSDMAVRLKELALQASSDTLNKKERAFANVEFQNLTQEIKRITQASHFDGIKVLDGNGRNHLIYSGIGNNPNYNSLSYDLKGVIRKSDELAVLDGSISNRSGARNALATIDSFINEVNSGRSYLGGIHNNLESTLNNLSIMNEGLQASRSQVRDTDMAASTGEKIKADIASNIGSSVLLQVSNLPNHVKKLVS